MPHIHLLPDNLVSQIAAGEVVERPASVVKELVENSLDAGATDVRVELESGGKRRIVVEDDGAGMGRDDALLAFDRHATSKIGSFDDLQEVATLGFRGEALASIAAVARVELITAEEPGTDEAAEGTRVRIEGGRVRSAEPTAHPRGTRISIASLFYNVPARRKFLKTPQTELRRCVEVVQGYALARPDVRFRLVHQGRELFDAPRAGEAGELGPEAARERIAQVFDRPFAGKLAAIPEGRGPQPGGGDERIWGLVGNPDTTSGRRYFIFVNRRLLRDRAILATFYRAVREVWRSDDFPALFLFLDVPPREVDVNVHPQKAEVRFRDRGIVDRVGERLRHALERALGEEEAPLRTPGGPPGAPLAGREWAGRDWSGWQRKQKIPGRFSEEPRPEWQVREGGPGVSYGGGVAGGSGWQPAGPAGPPDPNRLATASYAPLGQRAPVPLSGRSGETRPFRLLGQYKGTLVLLEGPDGLYLIDQHVAHERILFERLRGAMRQEATASQNLLTPVMMELSTPERMRLEELAPDLERHGFGVAPLSGNEVALTALPAVLDPDQGEKLVRALAAEEGEGDGSEEPDDVAREVLDALAASLACKGAVKMHHPLAPEEMETLVAELFEAENPYACPHGRPIVLQMTDADLERRFGRR